MEKSKEQIQRLIGAALGEIKAELIVTNGLLVNVYSGEILPGMEIAVLDGRICYVGPSARHARGADTRVIDAKDLYVAPGFIDGHTHIGHFCRPFEYLQSYVPHGTTALMASCDELGTVFGYAGLKLFLDEVARHPLRVFTLISMCAPQDPALCNTRSFSQAEVAEAMADPRVLGLGEVVSWLRLTQGDAEIVERIEMARRQGKIIHGHTAGARDQKLAAIAAAGVSSCHEPIRGDEALERLRLGYWVMLREGSMRQDLEAVVKPMVEQRTDLRRLILVTDSMSPDDVLEHGHIDHVGRKAIESGLTPVEAIQAVTLNPAVYSGLEQDIGGIAPGRFADMVLLEDLAQLRVHSTLIGGEIVARAGETLFNGNPIALPADMFQSLHLSPAVRPEQFEIFCPKPSERVRVMELMNLTITAERVMEMPAVNGSIEADANRDLLKVAVFDRHGASGSIALGLLKGFGARVGAVGTTANLDENTLLVAGSVDEDMALCANSLIAAGGGISIVDRRTVIDKMEMPAGGLFSLEPWRNAGNRLARLNRCLREKGSPFAKPLYALMFLTFVTLPSLRITNRGLVRAKERRVVSLFEND
jgi:adenine deaminase